MLKKKFAVILIFSLFSFCFFAQENGAEEKTVMTLSEIDSLIARNEYSAALEELSFYIQKYPLQFDKAQKRISKIMKERNAFNQKALELAQKMKQSAGEQLNDEQNDNLDSQKMELIVALENAEENPAKEAVDLTNDARRTIRLSYYLNRSNAIISQGTAMVAGGSLESAQNYSLAARKFAEGLSLKTKDSDVVFEGEKEIAVEYPEKLNSDVEKQIKNVRNKNAQIFSLLESAQKTYENYKNALTALDVQKSIEELKKLKQAFSALAQKRNEVYECGRELYSLEKKAIELNPGLVDTSYITFSRWAVLGVESNPDSGIVNAVDAFFNTRIEDLKLAVYSSIQSEYEKLYAGFGVNENYAATDSAFYFAGEGLELHSLYGNLADCEVKNYKNYCASLEFIKNFSKENLQNAFRLNSAIELKEKELLAFKVEENSLEKYAQKLLSAAKFYEEENTEIQLELKSQIVQNEKVVQKQFNLNEEKVLEEEIENFYEPSAKPLEQKRTTPGIQIKDEYLNWGENLAFYENILDGASQKCKKNESLAWGSLARAYSEESDRQLAFFTLENTLCLSYLNGVEETVENTKLVKFYPTKSYEKCLEINAGIKKQTLVLKTYREELNGGKESAETEKTYIDGCKNIEMVIAALNSLLNDCNKTMTAAKLKANDALKASNEARQLYSQAERYLKNADYDSARQALSDADSSYKKSLQLEENDSLRQEFGGSDGKIAMLDEQITTRQNNWVITNVRSLITEAYNDYYAGNFENSKRSLENATEIWEKTQAAENTEITELMSLVKDALESSGGTEIAYSDPLYKDMGTYLNNAKLHYEEGLKLFNGGKTEEGKNLLVLSRDEVRKVQRVFPKNLEANNLNLLINRILDPAQFNSTVNLKINQAKTIAASGKDEDLRKALTEMKELQKVIPENESVAKTVKDFEKQINRLAQSEQHKKDLERSTSLARQAQKESNLTKKLALLDEALKLNRRNSLAQKLKDEALISNTKVTIVKNYLDDSDEILYEKAEQYYSDRLKDQAMAVIVELFNKNPQVKKVIQLKRRIENM